MIIYLEIIFFFTKYIIYLILKHFNQKIKNYIIFNQKKKFFFMYFLIDY